ncbi:hypothetical protein J3R30DRAFT_3838721 [Lentinula aciculospora]|uniref:Glycosyl transferase CAP10 domain-containing protein n=1 Tax=Lentinula aciculospora TaxID=153920 RepID=A0A9W9DSB4_9AGAR|nr:hypothetical protein J3R30DRAFT_3838721 [Lentinula aciculospora]
MDFPINAKAEGRVIVPWEKRQENSSTTGDSVNNNNNDNNNNTRVDPLASFKPDWKGEGNVWDAWRRTCPPNTKARRHFSSVRSGMYTMDNGLPSIHPMLKAYRDNDPSNPYDPYHPFDPTNPQSKLQKHSDGSITTSRELLSLPTSTTPQFTFSPNTPYHDQSFCDDPHLHYTQGHFFSDWRTLGELYPVMSPARASGFSDIKIPSHYYYGSTARYTYGWDAEKGELREVDKDEVAWDTVENDATNGNDSNSLHKLNKIFWRGATTGGGNEPAGFAPMYQRHRAVRDLGDWDRKGMADIWILPAISSPFTSQSKSPAISSNRLSESIPSKGISIIQLPQADRVPYSQTREASDFNALVQGVEITGFDAYHDGGLYHLSVPYSTLNKGIMDIAFMQATSPGQYPGGLKKLLNDYRFDEGVPLGRFMAFLASDSVPIKSTVYEEFFGDWIEPWLHYIPLSAGYEEIYNIFAYFSGIPGEVVEQVYNDSDTYDYEGDNDSDDYGDGNEQVYNEDEDDDGGNDVGLRRGGGGGGGPSNSTSESKSYTSTPTSTSYPRRTRRRNTMISGAPDGDARLHRIALAGKQWKKTIGRTVDMEAYVYRLALEWARLCSDDREVMSMSYVRG